MRAFCIDVLKAEKMRADWYRRNSPFIFKSEKNRVENGTIDSDVCHALILAYAITFFSQFTRWLNIKCLWKKIQSNTKPALLTQNSSLSTLIKWAFLCMLCQRLSNLTWTISSWSSIQDHLYCFVAFLPHQKIDMSRNNGTACDMIILSNILAHTKGCYQHKTIGL